MIKKKGIACMLACTIIFNSVWQESSLVFAQEISFQDEESEIEKLDADITDELISEQLDKEGELDDIESDSEFSDLTDAEDVTQTEEEFGDGEKDSAWPVQIDINGNSEIIIDEKSGILFKKETDSDVEAIRWKNSENNKDVLVIPEKIYYGDKEYIVSFVSKELLEDENIILPKHIIIPDSVKYIEEDAFADFAMGDFSTGDIYVNENSYAAEYAKKYNLALNTDGIFISKIENNSQIQVGQSIQMQAEIPEILDDTEPVQWSAMPEDAAVFEENGEITFLNSGEIEVQAEVCGLKGKTTITVQEEINEDVEIEEVGESYGSVIANGTCGANSKDTLKWNLYNTSENSYTLVISGEGQMRDYGVVDNRAPWYEYIKNKSCKVILEKGMTSIGNNAFYYCEGLQGTLIIPEGVSSIGGGAFEACANLKGNLNIPNSVTNIGGSAFDGCKGFTGSLTIPDSVISIGGGGFASCEGLTGALVIPDSITEIGSNTFANCTGLNGGLIISNNVVTIGQKAFLNCSGLIGALKIPDGVTNIWREAFSGCSGFSGSITIPDSMVNIDKGAFYGVPVSKYYVKSEGCTLGNSCLESNEDKKIIYGYENSTAQSYAEQYGHEFRVLKQGSDIGECEYDYSTVLDSWLSTSGTNYSMHYLSQNKNFPNTMVTAANDEDFFMQLTGTWSNMLFRGLDGWKEIFGKETSREQAREILVALLEKQSENTESLSEAETAKKYADIFVKTLKGSNWAFAIEFGLDNKEIQELSKVCKSNVIENFFVQGEYSSISKCLTKTGKVSKQSDVYKCIQAFERSSELAESLTNTVKWMDRSWKFLSITEKTIKNIYDIESLVSVDEMYSEMLLFIKNNSSFNPVKLAAGDLYDVIHGEYQEKLLYAYNEIINEAVEFGVDKTLEWVTDKIPYGRLVRETYKYSVDIMNQVFKIEDMQKQKDNMRCVAYIGYEIARWMNDCRSGYYEAKENGTEDNKAAKKTVYAYYMLLKARIAGEESLQKMLEIVGIERKQIYAVSKTVLATLKSDEEWLKSTGVLEELSTSMVACPVNVEIYDSSGVLVGTVFDGKETEGYIGNIYYNVSYNSLKDDYVKIIRVPVNSGYTFKCVGVDLGSMDFCISLITDNGISVDKEVNNIPVKKGKNILVSDVSGEETKCVVVEKNQTIKEYIPQIVEENYIPITSMETNKETLEMGRNEKQHIGITILPKNATIQEIEWNSLNPEIAKVNADGVVLATGVGETIVTANAIQENVSAQIKIIVKPTNISSCKIELSDTSYVYNGSAKKPSVKITDGSYTLKNGTDYTVSYSKNINAGTAVVQITGKGSYTGSKNVNFSIKQANAKLEFKSTKMTKKFASGSFTNSFKTKKTDGKISYSSNNTKVASVDKNKGQIKIVGVGKATITATAKAGTNYKSGKASFVLTVTKANNTIKADNITKNMSKKSQTVNIKASVKDKAKLTYSSNNKSVKVSSKGKVTIAAKFSGKATITIKAAKTARYNSASKKITVTVKKPSQSKINMDIFKKKSVKQWLENMCYVRGFRDNAALKRKMPTIVRKDFLYVNYTKYKKYANGVDMLVPKKVVHDYIKDTYGITVSKVSLPVKNGKYLLKELWWQDETQVYFDKAVKTKDGAKIILKRKLFGKSAGQNEITVKPAKNPEGFVITSMKFYKNPTIQMAQEYIGKSLDDLILGLGDAKTFSYENDADNGTTGYYYYDKFTVSTTVDAKGNETVTGLW